MERWQKMTGIRHLSGCPVWQQTKIRKVHHYWGMEIWKSKGKFNSNRRSLISGFPMLSPLSLEVAAQRLVGLWNTFSVRDSLVAGTRLSPRSWSSFRMGSPRAVPQCLPCRWRREEQQFLQRESSFQGRKPSTHLEMKAQFPKSQVWGFVLSSLGVT